MPRAFAGLLAIVLAAAGCRPDPAPESPALRRDLELMQPQEAYLARLASAADASPNDFIRRKESGMAHMRFTLSGVLSLRDRAEQDLEAAFELDPSDAELTRSLGRFYNLRAVAGDDSKAALQVEVYRALLGDRPVSELESQEFVAWSFLQLGVVLSYRNRKQMLKALSKVGELEEVLESRTAANPDDIELWALAGNFAFFFAGNVPFGREARVASAVRYFDHVRAHWPELRDGAKDPEHCPNTYENFMFELAEGHLVLGNVDAATEIYRELSTPSSPVTRPKEQIAFVSAERLANAKHYVGDLELMPPWPSDVGNCVVCHAYTSDVPLTTLHTRAAIVLDDIPTAASTKPLPRIGDVPAEVRGVVDEYCVRCHSRGGAAAAHADFSHDEGVLRKATAIERRIEASDMPPNDPLPVAQRDVLLRWLRN